MISKGETMKIKKDRKVVTDAMKLGLRTVAELAAYIRKLEETTTRPTLSGLQA
jgi:hypothetical protein